MISQYFISTAAMQYHTLSLSLSLSSDEIMTGIKWSTLRLQQRIFLSKPRFYLWFKPSRSGSESDRLPCLHYKKIIRNIVINLIIKPKYIYIYQEIKPTGQIFENILL